MEKRQVTNMEVKKNNRNRVFRYIHKCGTTSNPDISYELKISLPTVTQNTKELLERGLIREIGELKSTGGRRAKALAVAEDFRYAAGIDITRNHVGMMLVNFAGEIVRYDRIPLAYREEEDYYREINGRLERFLEGHVPEREKILGIGISFPGIVDFDRQAITYSHVLGVKKLPFARVSSFFSYPCSFINDANAGAYAEGICREEPERFFYFSLSNTVGGAVFSYNELQQGKNFRCGEVGHMTIVPEGKKCYCGKEGCLDAYCSAWPLADRAGGKLEKFFEGLERAGAEEVRLWDQYTSYLAVAVNNIHMILDCDVVLGGYVGSHIEPYLPEIRQKVAGRNTFQEDGDYVKACKYKIEAAAYGAARKVIEDYIELV